MRSRSLRGGVTLAAVGVLTLTTIVLIGVSIAVIFTNYRGLLKDDLRRQSQHILEETGFTRCGVIHVADGSPRFAYQRMSLTMPLEH